jgi:thiamine-phosphate pyrophosphorylase
VPAPPDPARPPFPRAGLYLIADAGTRSGPALLAAVGAALEAGVRLVQYRAKGPLTRAMVAEAKALAERAHGHGAHLIVNDRADLARMAGADGVHVGQDDLKVADARRAAGPEAWVGVSVHDPAEARAAEADGADALGFGNVFGTRTKADAGPPLGTRALAAVCAATALPVYAIGGVGLGNLGAVKAAGAAGGAVVSAVLGADLAPEAAGVAAARLLAAWDGAPGPS